MQSKPQKIGSYTLLGMLAKGGMGEVFLAHKKGHFKFKKHFAVKKLLKRYSKNKDVSSRFIDEAKLGARLQHPNIIQVFDLLEQNQELYMATEFIDGFDLRRILRFCREKKKNIPTDVALYICAEILDGLSYAHRQVDQQGKSINLIHRDISPQNVLVSFEGEVKIIDFGLAKSTQRSEATKANVLLGNIGYMSPEQAKGEKLNISTDIYSAGIVLFELLTQSKRFVDDNPLRLLGLVARPNQVLPSDRRHEISAEIDAIYLRATHIDLKQRYQNAKEFQKALKTVLFKINPFISRDRIAKFMAFLFFGKEFLPEETNDLMNGSIAMHVQEVHSDTKSLKKSNRSKENVSSFDDKVPQTVIYEEFYNAALQQKFSHEQLVNAHRKSTPIKRSNKSLAEDELPLRQKQQTAQERTNSTSQQTTDNRQQTKDKLDTIINPFKPKTKELLDSYSDSSDDHIAPRTETLIMDNNMRQNTADGYYDAESKNSFANPLPSPDLTIRPKTLSKRQTNPFLRDSEHLEKTRKNTIKK